MLTHRKPTRWLAIAESLLANTIWASTFVLVKIGLNDLGPLTLGGLRYFAGFLLLLPLLAVPLPSGYRSIRRDLWIRLIVLGLSAYTLGNGAVFTGLKYMSATTGSFEMSLMPLLVLVVGIFWLKEVPTTIQAIGIIIVIVGSALFFSPGLTAGEPLGLLIVGVGLLGITISGILGREVARERQVDTLFLTAIPLAFGGGLLLVLGMLAEGAPRFTGTALMVVVWMAVVNTALAYMLYNHSLQILTAFEVNIMMNLTPLATAGLAWLFLGERLEEIQIMGMVVVIAGVGLVQWRRGGRRDASAQS